MAARVPDEFGLFYVESGSQGPVAAERVHEQES
jgi:hypothetical protein